MKKLFIAVCALALMAGAVSCKKDKIEEEPNNPPALVTENLSEGIYQPAEKIASINIGDSINEEWTWGAKNLDRVITNGDEANPLTFSYDGDFVTEVSGNGEKWCYSYSNNKLSKGVLKIDNNQVVEIVFSHNDDGKINSANLKIDTTFLMELLMGMIGGGEFPFANVLSRSTIESLAQMVKISAAVSNNPKFSMGSLDLSLNIVWNGDNVKDVVLNAGMVINIDTNDLNSIVNLGIIPEEFSTYISMARFAMAFTGGAVPLELALNDTMSYTYDNNRNPFYCYLGNGLDPKAFSYNNVTTENNHGAMTVSVTFLPQQTLELFNSPINESMTYNYVYNDNGYPTKCISDITTTYTYKE